MNTLKKLTAIVLFFATTVSYTQQKNIFLDRSFWNSQPNLQTVKQKVTEGNNATEFNENGFDATVYALLAKVDHEIIAYLLSFEENSITKRTHDSRIYLHWAAYAGKTDNVKTLLERGSDISARDSRGNTPLTFAAGSGLTNTEIYDLFIAKGIDLAKEVNQNGANSLLLASPFFKNEKDIDYFIKKGIDLNSTDQEGNGIFNYATRRGNIDLLNALIKKGIDYKTPNQKGGNAFFFAAQGTRGFQNSFEIYDYLKNLGLEPNTTNSDGYTPLHQVALRNTDPAIFELFLEAGADVNRKNADGNTPFLNAASQNNMEIVQLLSKNVTDYNTTNKIGQSALMLAVEGNSPEVVEFLLKKGGNPLAIDANGNSLAFYLAKSFNEKNIANFENKLQILQSKGVKLNSIQENGNTLYHFAANEDNLALMKRLSEFDIPVNAVNNQGMTALHLAAMKAKDVSMIKFLLEIGADKTVKTDFEETAFILASENEVLQKQNIELNFLK